MIDIYNSFDKSLYRISIEKQTPTGSEVAPENITSGEISGIMALVDGDYRSKNFVAGSTGWQWSADGSIEANNGTFRGTITATSGSIGGWTISTTALYYDGATDALSAGMASADYPFYAGKKYADRATAPFRVTPAGVVYATGAVIDGTSTLGGRVASTIASAIDSLGHFIDANLDTSSKKLLKDFTFGSTDYSGAFKTGDITWNAATGAITGGSGAVFHKGGLIFASAGVATITLDGVTGSATFAGTLSAAAGTLGTITSATITAGSFQTAAANKRITINSSDNYLRAYGSDGVQVAAIGGSLDATSRLLDLSISTDVEIARFLAGDNTGTAFILNPISTGYQSNRFTNQNTDAYRTTNNVPIIDLFQLGTGVGLKYNDNGTNSDGTPFLIQMSKTTNVNPIFKITQNALQSTNFRRILNETNTGCTIWISNGTTPNGNLSGAAGDICLNGDSGNIYRCTGTTNWTAM